MRRILNVLILVFVFLGFGFHLAYGSNSWVEITFLDGTKIHQGTGHSRYVTFDIFKHTGEPRGNVKHALCIHDWNGSNYGFQIAKDVYQKLVDQINGKSPQSIIEWDCHEESFIGWNDLWLDPANITRLENFSGDYIDIRLDGRRLIMTPRRL
ncbi:MAG: hypothetical protein Pg6B_11120 [Candidatus Azobacteroides pseudotrichonymphae]|nr:MAG: hypothetical protein Pg6B_11120 [Candidatus Azobacteroides pseudotrichonymphae]